MQKKNKTRILLCTTSIFLAISGINLKLNRDESTNISHSSYLNNYNEDDFMIAAHRGFSSLEIENTKKAISSASKQAYVDYIEIDARMTLDGKIVLSHNNNLQINPLTSLNISDLTYDQLTSANFNYRSPTIDNNLFSNISFDEKKLIFKRKNNLNNKRYQITGLVEGIKACQDKKILLDLKFSKNVDAFTTELQKELKDIDTSNMIFQSSNLLGVAYLQANTDYTCLAIMDNEDDLQYLSLFKNVGIRKNLITHDIIDKLLKENKGIAIWTINNTEELTKTVTELDDLYKDIIYITDYPDLIATKLHEIEVKEKIKK